jgi:hypothetical protein
MPQNRPPAQVGTPAGPAAGDQDATAGATDATAGVAGAALVPEMSEADEADAAEEAEEADAAEEAEEDPTPFELDIGMLAVAGLLMVGCLAMVVRLCGREINTAQTLESKYQQLRAERRRAAVYSKP